MKMHFPAKSEGICSRSAQESVDVVDLNQNPTSMLILYKTVRWEMHLGYFACPGVPATCHTAGV